MQRGIIMYCQKCGNEIPDNSVFCDMCGERVSFCSKTKPAQKKDTISIISPMDTISEDDPMLSMLPEPERKRVLKMLQTSQSILHDGQTLPFSTKNIVELSVNTFDAKQNLPYPVFLKVKALFDRYMMETQKIPMNKNKYLSIANSVIDNFNKIAPYELYCGDEAIEREFLSKHYYSDEQYMQGMLQEADEERSYRSIISYGIGFIVIMALGFVLGLF